jgi:type II secretory ATPase GspE/PulE/Tfp pilus assembly ATPase PilB-like protein
MLIDDRIREAVLKQPKLEVIRQVARQCGNYNLQDEAILLLAQGVTSIQEIQRVLK